MATRTEALDVLASIEDRVDELSYDSQQKIQAYAKVLHEFATACGAVGHIALNLAAARKAVEVMP